MELKNLSNSMHPLISLRLLYIFYFFILLSIITSSVKCACLQLTENDRPVLFCQSTIPSLPIPRNDIPAKIAKLIISGMNSTGQHNGILTRDNLTGLETLTYLQISNFDLKEIESHTFSAMEHLRILDLSKNRIITIRSEAFAGPSLKLLSLTDNKGIIFDRTSFHGAHVFHLAARNCDLTSLDYETIAKAKPKQLSLSDNILTWLDPQFAELVIDPPNSKIHHLSTVPPRPNLGYLDLSNNPLNCDCRLMWLSRLVESQSYDAYQYVTGKDLNNNDHKKDVTDWSNSPTESSIRLMQHMNMTCAQPPALAGKKLPRSWDYFCPIPSITGIEINMLKASADFAQLTCIGKGRPTPSLAWTYKIHGQKVQQILDPSVKQGSNDQYFMHSNSQSSLNILPGNKMIERKLALNVSLNSVNIENFTCTIWNNDGIPSISSVSTTSLTSSEGIVNPFKPTSLIVPTSDNHQTKFQYYRLHEVTVRVSGPLRPSEFINPVIIGESSSLDSRKQHAQKDDNAEVSMSSLTTTSQILDKQITNSLQEESKETYGYLFIKRFTLLELLGAVIGTFIATLALLYLATNCFSWFCQINNHLSAKNLRKSHLGSHSKWFSWINSSNNNNGHLLRGSKHQSAMNNIGSHHLNQNGNGLDAKLLQREDVETTCTTFADMVLATTTPIPSQFGSTTISARRPNIPQALLLTTVPNPRLEANSTPPPNPAYWPMPEYAYSGAGSHEYDVPRPLETFVGERCILKPGLTENNSLNPSAAQSFLSLAAQSLFPMNGTQLNRNDVGNQPNNGIFQTPANITPLTMQWTQTMNPINKTLTINPIISWQPNLVGSHNSSLLTDRQTQNSSYTNQPSTQSILYSADYPTYLQTRPYPHHKEQSLQQQQQQQLIELMTNSTRNYQSENFMSTPMDMLNSHDLPRKTTTCTQENKAQINGTNN
ncbi:unnamed protein product [Schistosoma curassoni]|uniref:Ig-like domain-containing protein n=1 Tax=Schistosoma curassoni TaxID=6186 RepID=A0A183KE86_9TREM|nr:unnamed protein product [Schistosoma curassoni]VDP52249.1 unnamed protein product [Schistosoma curassoni]